MDIRKLQRAIVDGLEDVKAHDIVVFNTEHLSPLFERVIIASGTSNRQTKSLAASVRDAVKAAGAPTPRMEGEGNGEWIIVDCGAAVVHVMQPTFRDYYHLEELWGDKPVRVKLGAGSQKPRGGSLDTETADEDAAPAPAAKKRSVRAPAATKPHAPAATKPHASAAGKSRERPAPSRHAAPAKQKAAPTRGPVAKKAVTRTVGVKTRARSPAAKAEPSRARPGSARPAPAASSTTRRSTRPTSGAKKAPARASTRKG